MLSEHWTEGLFMVYELIFSKLPVGSNTLKLCVLLCNINWLLES